MDCIKNIHNICVLELLTFHARDGGVWELPWISVEVDVIGKVVEGLVRWRNLSLVTRYF